VEIVIRVVDGQLRVNTNIGDKVVMLGVLELAKATLLAQAEAPAVQAAPPGAQKFLIGQNGR
jgi:hypothetical protein